MSEASSTSATLSADMTRLSLQPWVGKRWRSTPLISYKAWRSFPEIPMAPFRVCPKTCWQLEGYRVGWVMCTVWKRTCTTTYIRPRNSRQDMTRATSRKWRKGMERLQARCKLDRQLTHVDVFFKVSFSREIRF